MVMTNTVKQGCLHSVFLQALLCSGHCEHGSWNPAGSQSDYLLASKEKMLLERLVAQKVALSRAQAVPVVQHTKHAPPHARVDGPQRLLACSAEDIALPMHYDESLRTKIWHEDPGLNALFKGLTDPRLCTLTPDMHSSQSALSAPQFRCIYHITAVICH